MQQMPERRRAPALPGRSYLAKMTVPELITWLNSKKVWLHNKQQREEEYLEHRAARGVHTLTDETYEIDQLHELDILEAIDEAVELLRGLLAAPSHYDLRNDKRKDTEGDAFFR